MPRVNDLKKSSFLKREDCGAGVLLTIKGYELVNVAKEGAPEDMKYALHFEEAEKPLVLNATNGSAIERITGSDDFDNWIGAKVVLYDDPNVSFAGKVTGGIRIRAPRNQQRSSSNASGASPIVVNSPNPSRRPTAAQEANIGDGPGEDVPF